MIAARDEVLAELRWQERVANCGATHEIRDAAAGLVHVLRQRLHEITEARREEKARTRAVIRRRVRVFTTDIAFFALGLLAHQHWHKLAALLHH